jgi:hypothetical protein
MSWRLFVGINKNINFDFQQKFERATNIFGISYQGFCHTSIKDDKILVIVWITTKCPYLIKFDIDTQTLTLDTNIINSIDFYLNTHKRDEILRQYELELPPCPENNFLLLQDSKYDAIIRNYHPLLKEINDPEFINRIRTCFEKINVYVVDIIITNTYINIILSHKYIENTFYMYMLIDGTIEIRKNISSAFTKTPYLIFNYIEENKYDNLHIDVGGDVAINSPPVLNSPPVYENLNSPPVYEPIVSKKRARMSPDTVEQHASIACSTIKKVTFTMIEPSNIPLPGLRADKVQNFLLNPNDACTQTDIIGKIHVVLPVRQISPRVLSELSSSLATLSSFINSIQN